MRRSARRCRRAGRGTRSRRYADTSTFFAASLLSTKSAAKSALPVEAPASNFPVGSFDGGAQRHRGGRLRPLRHEVEFRADEQVADVVAAPSAVRPRIAVDDAADLGVVDEDRPQIALDPGVDQKRSENLGAVLDADAERAGEIADVGEALNEVGAAAVAARRPLAIRQHFGGWHEPQAGVAEKRRRGRPRVVSRRRCGGRLRSCSRTGLRVRRGCDEQNRRPHTSNEALWSSRCTSRGNSSSVLRLVPHDLKRSAQRCAVLRSLSSRRRRRRAAVSARPPTQSRC